MQTLAYFGRFIDDNFQTLNDFETLQQSTTLYCSTDGSNSPTRINWTFKPHDLEIEELLTNSARWDSSGVSKLQISTSKLGYYSCLTTQRGFSKSYTVKLTQSALKYGKLEKSLLLTLYFSINFKIDRSIIVKPAVHN